MILTAVLKRMCESENLQPFELTFRGRIGDGTATVGLVRA
jgi:hypothetical protein